MKPLPGQRNKMADVYFFHKLDEESPRILGATGQSYLK